MQTVQNKIPVAILGATGTVGQKAISLLQNNPRFYVAEIAASTGNIGKKFKEAMQWRDEQDLPANIAEMTLKDPKEVTSRFALSALPTEVALEVEPHLASKGTWIFSNAAAFRMDDKTPLLIPEINLNHLELLKEQKTSGKIVTNPNCSTVFFVMGLAPLLNLGTLEHASVVTLQAASGAGYPGVPSLDLLSNIIPFIGGEEAKIETETKKILGTLKAGAITPTNFSVTCHVHRVPVANGHTVAMHLYFKDEVKATEALKTFHTWNEKFPGLYKIHTDDTRPQPLRDLTSQDMRIHVGRIKQGDAKNVIGLVSLGHNVVRGAAGAALLNMEKTIDYLKLV